MFSLSENEMELFERKGTVGASEQSYSDCIADPKGQISSAATFMYEYLYFSHILSISIILRPLFCTIQDFWDAYLT